MIDRRWAALLLVAVTVVIAGDAAAEDRHAAFMQVKLKHSQEVLNGLVMEDYDRIARMAEQMRLMSLDASWQVIQTREYTERSRDFRRSAELLKEMAKEENIDGSTLAFFNVTQNCVSCHKYVRGQDR